MSRRCECEREWLSVSMCQPCDSLAICPGCTRPSPNFSWDRLQPPPPPPTATLNRIRGYRKWKDGYCLIEPNPKTARTLLYRLFLAFHWNNNNLYICIRAVSGLNYSIVINRKLIAHFLKNPFTFTYLEVRGEGIPLKMATLVFPRPNIAQVWSVI